MVGYARGLWISHAEWGSSSASSCSESSSRGAPIFSRLPNYPSINTDVMAGGWSMMAEGLSLGFDDRD